MNYLLNLRDVEFVEKDPAKIEEEIITNYKRLTNRTLARVDIVRLLLVSII